MSGAKGKKMSKAEKEKLKKEEEEKKRQEEDATTLTVRSRHSSISSVSRRSSLFSGSHSSIVAANKSVYSTGGRNSAISNRSRGSVSHGSPVRDSMSVRRSSRPRGGGSTLRRQSLVPGISRQASVARSSRTSLNTGSYIPSPTSTRPSVRSRLLAAEEALLKAAADEARMKAEQEENERLEKEREEVEEKRKLENEERKRRKGQLLELEEKWTENRSLLAKEGYDRRKDAKWARYMLCDGSPDPTIPREINTYMNLWLEDTERPDIDKVLGESKLALKLINELRFILDDTPDEEITEMEISSHKEILHELEKLLQDKLDAASYDLLLKATSMADAETMNLQQIISDGVITLCMWGNLSKNPRIKSFEFADMGVTFEIPKVLTLSDCSLRILFTEYDHYSKHCRSYLPRIKKQVEEAPVEEVKEVKEGEKEGEATEEGEKKEGEEAAEEGIEREETEGDKEKDVLKELQNLDGVGDEEKPAEAEKEPTPAEMEEEYEIQTPEPDDWEEFDGDEDVIDLRAYSVMGPIFHLNLLQLPPQPKNVADWVMTIVESPKLVPLDYAVDVGDMPPPSAQSNRENESEEGDSKKERREEKTPISIAMQLPRKVYFCEEPQVARWEPSTNEWQLDGFSDHSFDEEKKIVTFKTAHFGVMALMQDSHINMPFQSWELRPRGPNHALFTIIAAIVELELEIKDGKCCMVIPEDRPELEHFRDQWIPTADMIKKLKKAGINVFPEPDSHKYVSVQQKNSVTEERLYQQMAMTASAMAYSWSKWNTEVQNKHQLIVQGCEHLEDEPLLEEDWSLFLVTKMRTTKLRMTEFDDTFSDDHAEGTEFHADLYHMTSEIISDEGRACLAKSSHHFIDSIYTLLKASRVITYS